MRKEGWMEEVGKQQGGSEEEVTQNRGKEGRRGRVKVEGRRGGGREGVIRKKGRRRRRGGRRFS